MSLYVHDNHLISYCVQADKKEIRFHTVDPFSVPLKFTDVLFTGVVCYYFESDNFQTIIFGIVEINADAIYVEYEEMFLNGRKYGWPGTWSNSEETVLDYLIDHEIKGFRLSSSLGMVGWVLAKSMSLSDGAA